jgi:hypothetical protein
LDNRSPELKQLIDDMLAAKGEKDVSVNASLLFDGIAISLISKGEHVPLIPLDQNYRTLRKTLPTVLAITPLLRKKVSQPGPLPRMLERALAELRWRQIGNSVWQ